MKGDLHRRGKLYDTACPVLIYAAFGGEKTHYDGMGAQPLALLHLTTDGFILVRGITEIPFAGTDEHMGAEMQLMETIVDIVGYGSETAHIEPTAQLYAFGSAL